MDQGLSVMDNTKVSGGKGRGQRRSTTLSMKVWPELKEALDRAAAEDGRSTSQYIERALIAHLQDKGAWPN
jgi:hypothetical protein